MGKSTLISTISNARPKIANYHFTTLSPNLGVVMVSDSAGHIVADVLRLIKGAHEGIGLGIHSLGTSKGAKQSFIFSGYLRE